MADRLIVIILSLIMDKMELIGKLRDGVETIMLGEVLPMLYTRETMKKLRATINGRPNETDIDELAQALQYSYVGSMVMSVCRQTDEDRRTNSLRNLLVDILKSADYFNRDWYSSEVQKALKWDDDTLAVSGGGHYEIPRSTTDFHNQDDELGEDFAVFHFDSTGGNNFFEQCGHLKTEIVRNDLSDLIAVTEKIRSYRNKFIAHSEWGVSIDKGARFDDLNASIDLIYSLTQKYYLLLRQAGFDANMNSLNHAWLALLPTCKRS